MIVDQVIPQQGVPTSAAPFSRWRIAIIGAVAVLAAGIGLVLGLTVLQGRGSSALGTAAAYVPSEAATYMEVRLDLPAGQRAALRSVLDRFPGVEPDSVLGDALADTLDDALAATPFSVDYSSDIAPWFDGHLAVTVLDFPTGAGPMDVGVPSSGAMVGVRDPAAALAFADTLRREMASGGLEFTSSEKRGVTIWSMAADGPYVAGTSGTAFAYAVTDDQLLLATSRTVLETLLDVHAGNDSLADRDELNALSEHLPAEWVGLATVNVRAMLDAMQAELANADPGLAQVMDTYLDGVPPLAISTLAFEDDAVRMDAVAGLPTSGQATSNSRRTLAASVPGDAIFFSDGSNIGAGLARSITAVKTALAASANGQSSIDQLDQVEAALGSDLEDFVSWIGSGAMAAGWDGEQPYGGLVLEAGDPAAATQRLGQLRALAELAAMDSSMQIDVSTESVGGVDVTTITAPFSAMASDTPSTQVALQYALNGDTVVIGFGDRFVGRVLGIQAGDSLADSDRYTAAIERFGGSDNAGSFFLDLTALRSALEATLLPLDTSGMYASQIKAYVEPFDYLAGVTRVEGNASVARYGVVLQP